MTCEETQAWLVSGRSWTKKAEDAVPVDIAEHLAGCEACRSFQSLETNFDGSVHEAMHQVAIPIHLEQNLVWKLRQARRERQRARVLYWSLSAAAAILIAVCLNWYLQRPYDLARLNEAIASEETRRTVATYDPNKGRQPADLQQWLQRQGVAISIPNRLKLQFLSSAYIVDLGGRKVPVLEMRVGGSTSIICLLQRRFFNEQIQKKLHEQDNQSSFVIADTDESSSLGWMIVDRGSAHLFVDGMLPQNGV